MQMRVLRVGLYWLSESAASVCEGSSHPCRYAVCYTALTTYYACSWLCSLSGPWLLCYGAACSQQDAVCV